MKPSAHRPHHYLGLDLAGAKNQKTTVSVLGYFPKEKKVFLLEVYDRIPQTDPQDYASTLHPSDHALIELIDEYQSDLAKVGTTAAISLPPFFLSKKPDSKTIRWMHDFLKKTSAKDSLNGKDFTPYTQRPVELWIRKKVLPQLPASHRFDIDETLGGARAPLNARMSFLQSALPKTAFTEVWPKLTVSLLAMEFGLERRVIASYRQLEDGIVARERILDAIVKHRGIFIYERDLRKLSHNLNAFDSFFCAYSALLEDLQEAEERPVQFPREATWISFPNIARATR